MQWTISAANVAVDYYDLYLANTVLSRMHVMIVANMRQEHLATCNYIRDGSSPMHNHDYAHTGNHCMIDHDHDMHAIMVSWNL